MEMPDRIDPQLFAPCGMNCMVCYKHCMAKNACSGCMTGEDPNRPDHCRKCAIRECTASKQIRHCLECKEFPCKRIKSLDKSYRSRYGQSLTENSLYVRQHGLPAFLDHERNKWTCGECGGVISLHDARCSACGSQAKTTDQTV